MCVQYANTNDLKMGRLKSKHKNIVTFIPINPVSVCVCQINKPADKHALVTKNLAKNYLNHVRHDIRICS